MPRGADPGASDGVDGWRRWDQPWDFSTIRSIFRLTAPKR